MDAIVCGFGNLGFRHVEGLITSKVVKQISIVEISESTFVKNMDRVNTLEDYSKNVFRFSSLEKCPKNVNLAIIATTADCRAENLMSLLRLGAKNIIIEKVPFNSLTDIKKTLQSYEKYDAMILVNTPRRIYSAYMMVAKLFKNILITHVNIMGVTDLATNCMHFLDLVNFLSSKKIHNLKVIPKTVYESKRSGFVEFSGKIVATFKKNEQELECVLDSFNLNQEIDLYFTTDHGIFNVKEKPSEGTISVITPDKKEYLHKMEFQSALTKEFALRPELVRKLPSFQDIAKTNSLLLEALPVDSFLSNDNQRYKITWTYERTFKYKKAGDYPIIKPNMKLKRIGIIPARGGSKRIPKKNIRDFCGSSLLELALEISLESNIFSKIILSSDDKNIISMGNKFQNVELHHRPADLSTDHAGITDLFRMLIEKNKDTDFAYLIEPTSVFRNSKELKSLVAKFEGSNACSFGTISEVSSHPKKMFAINKHGLVKNITTNGMTTRSQDLEPFYEFNGILYGVNVKKFLSMKQKHITFGKILGIETPRQVFDINNLNDFQLAEAWYYYDKKTIRTN